MAVNPYQLAGVQRNLLSSLVESEQSKKEQEAALGRHKGEMSEEFQKEVIEAQQKAEAALSKKRKKKGLLGAFESVSGLLGLIPGIGALPILSSTLGALGGMSAMYGQGRHAKKQAEIARQAMQLPGMEKWEGTFLGSKARDIEAESKSKFDEIARQSEMSMGDILTKGLTSGIASFATGKIG